MTTPKGGPLDQEPIYAGLAPGEAMERRVVVTRRSKAPFPARLTVMRLHASLRGALVGAVHAAALLVRHAFA